MGGGENGRYQWQACVHQCVTGQRGDDEDEYALHCVGGSGVVLLCKWVKGNGRFGFFAHER